jgi:hypothetical protein
MVASLPAETSKRTSNFGLGISLVEIPQPSGVDVMKQILSKMPTRMSRSAITILVLFLAFEFSVPSSALAAGAVSSGNIPAPQGVKVLAQVQLQGLPATRLYTQWEQGNTYLYIEYGGNQLTAVDITKPQNPRVVDHQPGRVTTPRYEELAEGGVIEVSPNTGISLGVDNVRDRGTLSILQADDPRDAQLLQFFGHDLSNLVDRDHGLIFLASPTRLLIVKDQRWYGMDYNTN